MYKEFQSESGNACAPNTRYKIGDLFSELKQAFLKIDREKIILFQRKLDLTYLPQKETEGKVCYLNSPEVRTDYQYTFSGADLLDYFYAVLHSCSFRVKRIDFMSKEFPWDSCPHNSKIFWKMVELGGQLKQIHLNDSLVFEKSTISFPVKGDNIVKKIYFKNYDYEQESAVKQLIEKSGVIYINDIQYFANVPATAWELYLAGIQPSQKWLDERIGLKLNKADIDEYQMLIAKLVISLQIFQKIDSISFE